MQIKTMNCLLLMPSITGKYFALSLCNGQFLYIKCNQSPRLDGENIIVFVNNVYS